MNELIVLQKIQFRMSYYYYYQLHSDFQSYAEKKKVNYHTHLKKILTLCSFNNCVPASLRFSRQVVH